MLQFSLPSLNPLKLFSSEKQTIDLSPVKVHNIDYVQEKPARALKHLLKLNHANYAILYNHRKFHNHAPHVSAPFMGQYGLHLFPRVNGLIPSQLLSAAYLQGADADDLTRLHENESKLLDAWVDSPAEITTDDWRDHLGCRE